MIVAIPFVAISPNLLNLLFGDGVSSYSSSPDSRLVLLCLVVGFVVCWSSLGVAVVFVIVAESGFLFVVGVDVVVSGDGVDFAVIVGFVGGVGVDLVVVAVGGDCLAVGGVAVVFVAVDVEFLSIPFLGIFSGGVSGIVFTCKKPPH